MANLTIYKGKKYYDEIYDDKADLYATNGISDDSIKGLKVKEERIFGLKLEVVKHYTMEFLTVMYY